MVSPVNGPRRIVIRANRETLALVAAACAATFALAISIHARPPAPPTVEASQPDQEWAGNLTTVASDETEGASTEPPLTSASLVVPRSALALPTATSRGKTARPCESATPCTTKIVPLRVKPTRSEIARSESRRERSLMSRLNPFNHLPDMASLGRPFAAAGTTISGWFDRL